MERTPASSLDRLNRRIVSCRLCPRLVEHRERVAHEKRRQFRDETYWGRPITGFGDRDARLLVVGLAPAAHGGNRTGRIFTGDRSGDWLYEAMHQAGFANQPTSTDRNDGLALTDAFVTAVCRCAPPGNQLLPAEVLNCRPYLVAEIQSFARLRVVMVLGLVALNGFFGAWAAAGRPAPRPKPAFGHGLVHSLDDGTWLVTSYHPSQQNTFTGKLTRPMLLDVFRTARKLIDG
jgi:uracil-DNA glycosylase